MHINKKLLIGSGAAAVILAGGIYGGTALAQTGSSSSSPSPITSASSSPSPKGNAQAQAARQAYLSDLAQKLNVSTDTLTNALKGAAKDQVANEVKSGRITQDQANKIDARIDSGQAPFGGFALRGGPGPRGGFGGGQAIQAAAKALNLQPTDLMQQLRSGKTLKDIATAQKVDYSTVATAITSAVKPQLDKAVSSGKLTQDQETNVLNQIQSGTFNFHPGPGGRPGGHGPRPNGSNRPSPVPSGSA